MSYGYLIGDLPVTSTFREVVRTVYPQVKYLNRSHRRAHYRGAWNALQGAVITWHKLADKALPELFIFPPGQCTGNPCTKCGAWYSALKAEEMPGCFGDESMSTTREQRLEWAHICHKPLLFPDITKFEELFSGIYTGREEAPTNLPLYERATGINAWCHRHLESGHYVSLYLKPLDVILEGIMDSDVVGGTKYFSMVDRGDNVTLVLVQWDQIIGSRWLAFIDTDSIPEAPS